MEEKYFSRILPRVIRLKKKTNFRKYKLNVLEWPGNSPELNPIENLWAINKISVTKLDCTTMTKLLEVIIQVWYQDTKVKENYQKLVESMRNRVKKVLKNKEGHINY